MIWYKYFRNVLFTIFHLIPILIKYKIKNTWIWRQKPSLWFFYFGIPSVALTVNTNVTTPLKLKYIEPLMPQNVLNNDTTLENITLLLEKSGNKDLFFWLWYLFHFQLIFFSVRCPVILWGYLKYGHIIINLY